MRKARFAAALAPLATSAPGVALADQLDGRLMGAWATSQADCKEAFIVTNGRASLRQPVNRLYVALIVEPGQIVATTGRCRVGNVVSKGDHFVVALTCNNAIGFLPVTARFKNQGVDQITYGSSDDALMDSSYARCR